MIDVYPEFLAAKHRIDERALNRRIWDRFIELCLRCGEVRGPLRILEIGAGLGATACRVIDRLSGIPIDYVLLDIASQHLELASARVRSHLESSGYVVGRSQERDIEANMGQVPLAVRFVEADATSKAARPLIGSFDILIGQALLDLIDLDQDLHHFMSFLGPGGVFYFPITYDGMTHFGPTFRPTLDDQIADWYNASMDIRAKASHRKGGSRAGRLALECLRARPLAVLDAGSSDWVIFAGPGGYTGDERTFLHEILHLIEKEMVRCGSLDGAAVAEWLACRREEVAGGELIYISHQLDLLGQLPG